MPTAWFAPVKNYDALLLGKSYSETVEQAVEQNIRNQQTACIPQLYKFAQIVMATNKNAV